MSLPQRESHTLRMMVMKAHLCLPGDTLSGLTLGCGYNGDSVSISMAGPMVGPSTRVVYGQSLS